MPQPIFIVRQMMKQAMEKLETKHEFSKGAWAGLIAGIVMFLFIELFRWTGLTRFGASHMAGGTIFFYDGTLDQKILSLLIHCSIGVFWGIILSFLFSKALSPDNYLFKSTFITFCIFIFHFGFLDEPFNYHKKVHEQTADLLVIMGGYIVYGLVLGIVLKRQKIIGK